MKYDISCFRCFQSFADELPAIVYAVRTDGSIEYISRFFVETTGHMPEAYYGYSWIDFLHPNDRDAYIIAHVFALSSGEGLSREVRLRMADKSYRYFRTGLGPMRDSNGTILRWLGVATEIIEKKREESDAKLELAAVSKAIAQIAWIADAWGMFDWFNQGWYEYTGKTRKESLGRGWQTACHPDDVSEIAQRWAQGIEAGEAFEMQMRLRRADGAFRWFLMRVHPLKAADGGGALRWYGTHIDIDEQKRALERSSRIAQTLQDVFLPQVLPRFEDLRIDAAYVASEEDAHIGGDWYDATLLVDGRILVAIGDVAGHGLEASLTIGRLRQTIFTIAFETPDPVTILRKVNSILQYQSQPYVTAIVGLIDPTHRTLTYACAGHPPPVLALRAHPPMYLPYGGLPLGIETEVRFRRHTVPLPLESLVVFYTDGLLESRREIETSERRLLDVVEAMVNGSVPAQPALHIEQSVLDGAEPTDDIAVLLVHRTSRRR